MKKSLSTLPQGLLAAYLRNQPDEVKPILDKILGACPKSIVNSSKELSSQETKPL